VLFKQRKQKGLTLIEVVISLVIIAILAGAVTPTITIYFQQSRLKGAVETLYDNVNYARTTAIQKATAVIFTFTTGASWCYGMSTVAGCDCTTSTNCNLGVVSHSDYSGTTLATTIGASTTFNATRGAPNNTGTVTFSTTSGGSQSVQLTLTGLGTSTLCSPSTTVGGYAEC
jgi:prepilin-type N-terminal cleavage/methylation domain-containing protein